MGTAFLGEPPSHIKEWIRKHHKQDQFNFLYKKEGDTEWQEWVPKSDDIQIVDGKATIMAASFKVMAEFADVREVKFPNKWKNGSEDLDVTSIGEDAFHSCSGLTSVTIPNGVTSIGKSAFFDCYRLTSIEFEGNAPTVGVYAFDAVASGCKAVISPTATGFPEPGETWNGLIVEVKP